MTLPYEDIRIVDFTQVMQGPSATQVLADFGAEVIKIERIDTGDIGREQVPKIKGMSYHWMANNRNKQSLSLDLRKREAKSLIYWLAEGADIVASNFRPGVMERLGFGYDRLREINPRIIWAAASGYGMTGPYEDRIGHDYLAQAMGGLMSLTGERDGPPVASGTWIIDFIGAQLFAQGMMAALAARARTGMGQVVDSSILNGAIACHHQENAVVLNTGREITRPMPNGGHTERGPLYAVFECKDGRYFALASEFTPDAPEKISRALEIEPSLSEDPRWQGMDFGLDSSWAVRPILEEAFKKFTRDEVCERIQDQGLPPGPVYDLGEVFQDPQVIHNDMVVETEHPVYGRLKLTGFPVKLSMTPATLRRPPPTVGEHNEEVLEELGLSPEEIKALQDSGAIGSENLKRASGIDVPAED